MKKCLIVMGYMSYGGVQKSLINFLNSIKDKARVDLVLWGRTQDEMPLPDWVNIIKLPTVKSIRKSLEEDGFFSKAFFLSCFGFFLKKRWKVMPKLKKHYDIAIAYPQVGYPKYYVIDKVDAELKLTFYHHGSYEFIGKIKKWDKEYYPKYDCVYCVSEYTQEILNEALQVNFKSDIMPNILDIEDCLLKGQSQCDEFDSAKGLKILTVARLSPEKNLNVCLDVAKRLKDDGVEFSWFIVGDGDLYSSLNSEIIDNGLETCVFLLGRQENPYRFMSRCDIYAQFSKYESESITVKEVSVFNKKMVLSDITAFRRLKEKLKNISIVNEDAKEIALEIEKLQYLKSENNQDLHYLNAIPNKTIKEMLDA